MRMGIFGMLKAGSEYLVSGKLLSLKGVPAQLPRLPKLAAFFVVQDTKSVSLRWYLPPVLWHLPPLRHSPNEQDLTVASSFSAALVVFSSALEDFSEVFADLSACLLARWADFFMRS